MNPSQAPMHRIPISLVAINTYPNKLPIRTIPSKRNSTKVPSVSGPMKNSPKIAVNIPKPVKYPKINKVGFNILYPKKHSNMPKLIRIIPKRILWFPIKENQDKKPINAYKTI